MIDTDSRSSIGSACRVAVSSRGLSGLFSPLPFDRFVHAKETDIDFFGAAFANSFVAET